MFSAEGTGVRPGGSPKPGDAGLAAVAREAAGAGYAAAATSRDAEGTSTGDAAAVVGLLPGLDAAGVAAVVAAGVARLAGDADALLELVNEGLDRL